MENSRGKGASADGDTARTSVGIGSVIADTYTIERVIGRGGMGTVFLASHKRLPGKQVAIKMLHIEVDADSGNDEVLHRFRHEAEIASTLGHPNIVKVDDFNSLPDGTPYLVLEYLQGETLAHRLRSGPIPLPQALSIVRQIGSALAAAHRAGIVHRDLKPHNIFLVPTEVDGQIMEIAKVLDFGISKIKGSQTVKTQDSTLLGTPQYMSPEQATGQHALVDERTDVFAFGSIVYEMLCGRPAFTGASIPEVVFKVVYEEPTPLAADTAPGAIITAVAHAMAKSPVDRFATVNAFVEALTGQAVLLPRDLAVPPPDIGFAAGSKVASKDAFAKTMDSAGGAPPINKTLAAPRAPVTIASPLAATIASQASAAPVPIQRPPAASRRIAAAIGVVAAAGAALVVVLVVMHRGSPEPIIAAAVPGDAAAHAAPPTPIPAVTPPTPPLPAPADAAIAQVVPADAATIARKPPKDAHPEPEVAGDPATAEALQHAEAASQAGDTQNALAYATSVINAPSPTRRQSLRAHVLKSLAYCATSNQDQALAELRQSGHTADARIQKACPFPLDLSY